jgi:hypothetical protein
MDTRGRLDPKNPIEVFWRVFDEDGRRHGLNWFEQTMAYGVSVQPARGVRDAFDGYVVTFPEMQFRVDISESGAPECIVQLNGHRARLISIYIELDESSVWPRPRFLNIYGMDTQSGRVIREHVEPAAD